MLIGMPGSGKTTIGGMIAEKLGYRFIDIDGMIEADYGAIPTLFERGEDYFRKCENSMRKKGGADKTGGDCHRWRHSDTRRKHARAGTDGNGLFP